MNKIKVRFAPSPTGPLHIGGARSALFNYLLAEHEKGELVLRIEDTDLERSRRKYEDEIIESLKWLGIKWSEGIGAGGDNGPYRQTERLEIYKKYIDILLQKGLAYYCFCSEEDLEAERQALLAKGGMPKYSGKCRNLTDKEVQERLADGQKASIRFKVPSGRAYIVDDLVRGKVSFESDNEGDFIIVKSDGIPTYNFAVVIDDMLMGITHVVRAEEHLSNTPRQLMVYEALGVEYPKFAHISLILGSDHQKMSKRHGATSLIQYREKGYLPEAMFNFLALLGWSQEGEKEILSAEEIISQYTLEHVAKSPAVFDLDKLNWINQQHLKEKSLEELKDMLRPYLENSEFAEDVKKLDESKYEILVEALRDRLVCLEDISKHVGVFLTEVEFEEEAMEVLKGEDVLTVLEMFRDGIPDFKHPDEIKQFIKSIVKQSKLKAKNVFMPLRSALSGQVHGPDLPYLIFVWGKEETLRRINNTITKLTR